MLLIAELNNCEWRFYFSEESGKFKFVYLLQKAINTWYFSLKIFKYLEIKLNNLLREII